MANLKDVNINDAYIKIPVGTTNQRPTNPSMGAIRFNEDFNDIESIISTNTFLGSSSTTIWANSVGNHLNVPTKDLAIHLDYHFPTLIQNPANSRSSLNLVTKIPTSIPAIQAIQIYTNSNSESTSYLYFNGNPGRSFTINEGASLKCHNSQTINFFIRPAARSGAIRENFYDHAYGGDGTITLEPDGTFNYFYGTSGGNTSPYESLNSSASHPITANQWQMYTLVRDLSGGTLKWYKNAQLISTGVPTYTYAKPSTNVITIGAGYAGFYTGGLAMLSVWRAALTATEISNIFEIFRRRYDL